MACWTLSEATISLSWGDGFYSENPLENPFMICLHWTTKPWTFQVRENHVVERMSKYIQYIYICIYLFCGKPNNKSPDYRYKWIKQVSPAMVYIGLRHWVYHWIHRRFGTPPEPVGMWSCSPALQQHSHWSHGSSLRMLIFHESECVYHVFTMQNGFMCFGKVDLKFVWSSIFYQPINHRKWMKMVAMFWRGMGILLWNLISQNMLETLNIEIVFSQQHGGTKLHKWKLTPNNGYFFIHAYIYVCVCGNGYVWVLWYHRSSHILKWPGPSKLSRLRCPM